MLTATELKALLRAHGLRLSKRLGQHYLVDARVVERFVGRCRLSTTDTVVEIGAGLGALTEPLARCAGQVIAVEVDQRCCALLRERMAGCPNVTVVCEDILQFSWDRLQGAVVIGAIPYHITSPILVSLGEQRRMIREAWLILQQEVAQRLVARPGTKAYGRLSVLGQYGWEITPVMRIGRHAFFPQPNVDSTCLHLVSRSAPPVAVSDERTFFELVKAAFAHRRKTLANCLVAFGQGAIDRAHAEALLRQLGLPPMVRGEALPLDQFASLANVMPAALQSR